MIHQKIYFIIIFLFIMPIYSCDSDEEQTTPEEQEQVVIIKPTEYHEYVDLGLPSGTLWASYNIGATKPEEVGSYFAWGEVAPKDNYNWQTYFDSENGSDSKFKKYYQNGGKTTLEPMDDAASVNWGEGWFIPSLAQIKEITAYTELIYNSERNGIKGTLVISKTNNATLFFPSDASNSYWTSAIYSSASYSAYVLCFVQDYHHVGALFRYRKLPIRPVRMTPIVSQ